MNLTEEELKESRKQALEVFEEIEAEKRGSSIPSTSLLDCPFCGAVGVLRQWHPKGHADTLWRAECSSFDCGALIGPYPDPDFAREQWNRRQSNPNFQAGGTL